ncbi:MAG: GNAT family N-acetyltransferase [Bacteroidota bacterium]
MQKTKAQKYGYLEGWVSLIVNSLLFVLKFWAGIVTGSVALIADAWHTLSDSFTSIILIIGFKLSSKPADKKHPYGHGRFELISALIIGVLLAVVGFNFLIDSISKLSAHESVVFGKLAIIATIISVVMKEGMAQFAFRLGKKVNAPSIKADGWHHRSDAISSAIILVGIFFGKQYWWIDGVLGIMVAILIFYSSYEIIKETLSPLLGEKADNILEEKINIIAKEVCKNDLNVHHLRVHQYGQHNEVTFHIELSSDISLSDAHDIANRLENRIINETGFYSTIHMEPTGTLHIIENSRIISFNFSDNDNFKIALEIRNEVFVSEQNVDPNLEFDGFDQVSTHYLAIYKNIPVATARWRETDEGIKLERFAVLKDNRNKGFAKILLDQIIKDVSFRKKKIYLNSQTYVVGFYEKFGFEKIGDIFLEANIEHYKMIYKRELN